MRLVHRITAAFLAFLAIVVSLNCRGPETKYAVEQGRKEGVAPEAAIPYTLDIELTGLIGFVKKADSVLAMLVNTSSPSFVPANCKGGLDNEVHYGAIRIPARNLSPYPTSPQDPGDELAIIGLHGDDISVGPQDVCTTTTLKLTNDSWVPALKDFASDYHAGLQAACKRCATDDINDTQSARVIGRYNFNRGELIFYREITDADKNPISWSISKKNGTTKDYPQVAQRAQSILDCNLAPGTPMILTLTNPTRTLKLPLYPNVNQATKKNEIVIEIANLRSDDLLDPDPVYKNYSPQIPHFRWFYALSSTSSTYTGTCPFPKTIAKKLSGKPFCSFAFFEAP